MPQNHLISLDGDYLNYSKPFEEILNEMQPSVPFSSQPTKDGKVYTVHFKSSFQYEEFKIEISKKIPFLNSIFS